MNAKFNFKPYQPAPKYKNKHFNTIVGDLTSAHKIEGPVKSFKIPTLDQDHLTGKLYEPKKHTKEVVVMFHGLSGNCDSGYMQRTGQNFLDLGYAVLLMNHRNCGPSIGLSKQPYSSGRSEDLGKTVYEVRKLYPNRKVFLIGFSMSGNAVLLLQAKHFPLLLSHSNYLNDPKFGELISSIRNHIGGKLENPDYDKVLEENQLNLPDFAIAVNPPANLSSVSSRFGIGLNRIYEINFMKNFRRHVRELFENKVLQKEIPVSIFQKIEKFDDQYTAPRMGYKSAQDYYSHCSSLRFFNLIKSPTLIISAEDDPIIDATDFIPFQSHKYLDIYLEKHGGHMGYLEAGGKRWLDQTLTDIVSNWNLVKI